MAAERIVFAGTPDFAVPALNQLVAAGYSVPLVITQPDRPVGRSKQPQSSVVALAAQAHGLTVTKPSKISEAIDQLTNLEPALLVVAAYGQILPSSVLDIATHGSLNIHGSLLPAYRGASPVHHAILDGANETGVTIMQMDEGLDTGPIISQCALAIATDDTAQSLSAKLSELGAELLVETLPGWFDGTVTARPQTEPTTPVTRLIRKADGQLDWHKPATYLERQVRAMYPWPVAWSVLDTEPVRILEAKTVTGAPGKPGGFLAETPLRVHTGEGSLQIERLQPAGRKPLTGTEFLRGYRGSGQFTVSPSPVD